MSTSSPFRSRTALIVPLVLLVVAVLEDIVTYKVRQHVRDLYLRAGIIPGLTGVGFVLAAEPVYRQWTLSFPRHLRFRLLRGAKFAATVLTAFVCVDHVVDSQSSA